MAVEVRDGVEVEELGEKEESGGGEVASLRDRVSELEGELEMQRRRARIDEKLIKARAQDVAAARAAVEEVVSRQGEVDVDEAVRSVRRSKPELFKAMRSGVSAMSGRSERRGEAVREAADAARARGDGKAMLEYLRLRRAAV